MALIPTFGNQAMPWLSNNSDTLLNAGVGLLSGSNPQQQVAGLAQGVGAARQRNKTIELLRQTNPDLAAAVESGALSGNDAYKLYYAQKLEAQKPRNNFLSAGGSLYNAETGQWITPPANPNDPNQQDKYFGTTIPYYDKDGNLRYKQLAKGGPDASKDLDFGPGGSAAPPTRTVDTGTELLTVGPGGEVISRTKKDVAGAATQAGLGKAQSDAATAVLPAKQIADQLSQQIAALKADPALPNILGPIDSRTPNFRSDSIAAQARLDQLKGGAFLSARQMLKGGGQITDYEGQRADKAIARMDQAQSPEDFKAALDEFNDAVQTGVQKLQMQAQGNFGVQPAAPGPAAPNGGAGVTSGGIKFSVGQ